jgi:hypothetical protein
MVRQAKRAVVRMLTFDVLRPWVIANWGEAALPLVPALTLGTTEAPDLSALMLAVASLEKAAWFTPSQKPEVDLLLNLPQRTPAGDGPGDGALHRAPSVPHAPHRGTGRATGRHVGQPD